MAHADTPFASLPPAAPLSLSRALGRSLATVRDEVDVALPCAEGALPEALRGVLWRNGPGRLERGGVAYGHPFDGDGMVTRYAFTDAGVRYRNRFVRTREWADEERAGAIVHRGFGTDRPGGLGPNLLRLRFKNAANTSVVWHGGRLLALWEGGLPHALDPDSLATLGRFDYAGRLRNTASRVAAWVTPELPFSAHPRLDRATGVLYNFGTLLGATPQLVLYTVDPDGTMRPPEHLPLPAMSFVHDFVLTRHHRVFVLPPVHFDVPRTLLGLVSPVRSLSRAEGRACRVLVLPREGTAGARWVEAPSGFVFHWANGYERDDGTLVLEGFCAPDMPATTPVATLMEGRESPFPPSEYVRYLVRPGRADVTVERTPGWHAELPRIHPAYEGRAHRYVWAIGRRADSPEPIFADVVRFDAETGAVRAHSFADEGFPGEPVMIARPGATAEDDGWVVTVLYNGHQHRSHLIVLDAATLDTVARFPLPHHQPPGFHGFWRPQTV